jgi:hypothetical protein
MAPSQSRRSGPHARWRGTYPADAK